MTIDITVPTIVTIVGALYIISPIDLVPDVVPFAGWIDDFIVGIGIAIMWLVVLGIMALRALMPVIAVIVVALIAMLVLRSVGKSIWEKVR